MLTTGEIFNPIALAARAETGDRAMLMGGLINVLSGHRRQPKLPPHLQGTFRTLAGLLPEWQPATGVERPTVLYLLLPEGNEEGEFLEIDYEIAGEWFAVMGRVHEMRGLSYLRVSSEDYQTAGRRAPAILYSLYYLDRLLSHYPPSVLLSALRYTYPKRNHVNPQRYFLGMLKQWRLRQEVQADTPDGPALERAEPEMSPPQVMNAPGLSSHAE